MGDFRARARLGLAADIPRCAPSSVALAAGQPSTATHIAADASFHTHIYITVKRRAAPVCIATIGPRGGRSPLLRQGTKICQNSLAERNFN